MSFKSSSIASLTVLAFAVSACSGSDGGGDEKAYCTDLKASAGDVKALAGGDLDGLDQAFDTARKLAGEAPAAVRKQWDTIDDAATAVQKAFEDAGLKISDVKKIQSGGDLPKGVDLTKLAGLSKVYSDYSGKKFTDAEKAIADHAKKTCKVDLGLSS